MMKCMRVSAAVSTVSLLVGCQMTLPVTVQRVEVAGQKKETVTVAPSPDAGKHVEMKPAESPTPTATPPSPSPSATQTPEVRGIRVTGKIYGTNPKAPWNSTVRVNDVVPKTEDGKPFIDTVLTPEADGKTYLYANTTGLVRGAVDHIRADHGKFYGGNYSAGALKWIKIEVPNNAPTANIDLFLSYSVGHALADKPGTHTMGFPTYLGETKRVITVAPMYKNGERRYKTPMVSETMLWLEEGKTYQVETDGSSSVKLENIEDGRWYAFQAKLTLPNGEAETTVSSFLGGRTATTILLGEDKVATPFDPNDPSRVL